VAGLAAAFGSGAMTNSVDELAEADVIFVTGSNTTAAHPLVATRLYEAKKRGAKILLADPRKIHLAMFADVYVSQALGTDVALLNGIMNHILAKGLHDEEFIKERTEEFEAFREVVEQWTPERASEVTGIPADDIKKMAEIYAGGENSSIVYCMGITQHVSGVDNVKSLANLAMLTGNIGKASTGVNPLRGQNNVQGACDMGGLPDVFPGYQKVGLVDVQDKFEKAWGVKLSDQPGLKIPDMVHGLDEGTVKALYVLGENPLMSDPDENHVRKALSNAELVILQDIFPNETMPYAHVVLPGAAYAEKNGTFVNTERRVQRIRKAVDLVGDNKPDWEIIRDLSNRFGFEMNYDSPEAIFNELATVTPQYAGISYDRLEGEGISWPCPDKDHPGTKFLHAGKFARGLGLFHAIEFRPPAEVVDDEYPMWLTTGRAHVHYHTGTMTRNSPTLDAQMPEGFVEINPQDAEAMGIAEDDPVSVSSRRGEVTAKAMLTDRVMPGMVFMPFHFAESSANVLTNPALDPICKIPEYKVCAVRVKKAA
jgi:formate dehydrogenase major subunit